MTYRLQYSETCAELLLVAHWNLTEKRRSMSTCCRRFPGETLPLRQTIANSCPNCPPIPPSRQHSKRDRYSSGLTPSTIHRHLGQQFMNDPWAPTVPTRLATRNARKSWKKIVRFKMGEPRARGESSACQVSPGGPIHAQCDMIRQDGPLGSGLCGLLACWTSDWGRRLQVRRASSKNAKKPKKRSWPAVPNNSPTGRRLRRHWLSVPSAILARWQAPLKFQRFTLRHPTLVALCLACLRKRRRDPCRRTQPAPEVPATRLAHQPHNAPFPLRISQGVSLVVVWKPGDQESIFHLVSWRRQWPRCR